MTFTLQGFQIPVLSFYHISPCSVFPYHLVRKNILDNCTYCIPHLCLFQCTTHAKSDFKVWITHKIFVLLVFGYNYECTLWSRTFWQPSCMNWTPSSCLFQLFQSCTLVKSALLVHNLGRCVGPSSHRSWNKKQGKNLKPWLKVRSQDSARVVISPSSYSG